MRLAAERSGSPFLLYRDEVDELRIAVLDRAAARLTVGRDRGNDLALTWDPEVSRVHAALELIGGEWTILDDGLSRNGTFLNSRRIHGRRRLCDGDCLRVGRTALLFVSPAAAGGGATVASAGEPVAEELTAMQRRILRELCRPLVEADGPATPASNREIAAAVHLSVEGVKGQLRTLAERFGVAALPQNRKRLALAERALASGLGAPVRD